ncbi:MAG TPA: hypothetical protein DCE80_17385 [Ignavibacteriales bacterium]|nr:hypothetical protein [Ignavibacteriales bacterium]
MSRKEYSLIRARIIEELEYVEIVNVVPEVIAKTISLLERYDLHTLDSIHVALATVFKSDFFITSDKKRQ